MRKKLFAVIMSVMMMVTFMPSMAFADQQATGYSLKDVHWNADFKTVSGTLVNDATKAETSVNTETVTNTQLDGTDSTYPGAIKTVAKFDVSGVTRNPGDYLEETIYLYNLNKAQIVKADGTSIVSCDANEYLEWASNLNSDDSLKLDALKVKFHSPSATELKGGIPSGWDPTVSCDALVNKGLFNIAMYPTNYEAYDADGDYKFPLFIDARAMNNIGEDNGFDVMGTAPTEQTIKIVYNAASFPANGSWTLDGKDYTTPVYNGKDQVVKYEAKGFTFEYRVDNTTTGKLGTWTTEAPKFKNAGETFRVKVRATREGVTGAKAVESSDVKTISVAPLNSTLIGNKFFVGDKINKSNLFTLSNKNLQDVDKATFATLVDKYITLAEDTILSTEAESNPTVYYTVDAKGAKADAAVKQLLLNYDLTLADSNIQYHVYDAEPYVVAKNQTKTFHIKKAAKLKSNKTFKLSGDITNFEGLKYVKKSGNSKIKVAANGKVTVKKGLKKGTYKVKVKVLPINSPSAAYAPVYDWKTVTVKIAK